MRSLLLVPGHDAEAIAAGLQSGADGLVIDLAGAGSADRAAARRTVRAVLSTRGGSTSGPAVYVRIAAFEDPAVRADLEAVVQAAPDGIVLSHLAEAGAIALLDARLSVQEALHGLPDRTIRIVAAVGEHASPTPSAEIYRDSSPRLAALLWVPGAADSEAQSARASTDEILRNLTLLAALGAGLPAIDAWTLSADAARLELLASKARGEGFAGMLAADAACIATINAVFDSAACAPVSRDS